MPTEVYDFSVLGTLGLGFWGGSVNSSFASQRGDGSFPELGSRLRSLGFGLRVYSRLQELGPDGLTVILSNAHARKGSQSNP